jgi:glycosyltransferase involved in cell wall biosynthesis
MPFELPVHPRTSAVITEALRADPVDVMHVHVGVVSPFAWGAIRAAVRLQIPVLVTVHSMWGALARPGYAMAERLSGLNRHRVLFSGVSSAAADRVSRSVPSVGPVRVIPNGIDESVWAPTGSADPAVREQRGPLEVVSVMRMAPRKRTLPLVRIAEEALARGADLHLTLVGDGPDRAQAERYVQRHGLGDSIVFTGRLSGSQIRVLYRSSDLFIQPSGNESFGIAALEARTAGLPVLARSQSGTVDFIHDGTEGIIVDDDDAMARALTQLAADRESLARLAQHNRASLPDQVWSRVLGEVDAAYAAVMGREDLG